MIGKGDESGILFVCGEDSEKEKKSSSFLSVCCYTILRLTDDNCIYLRVQVLVYVGTFVDMGLPASWVSLKTRTISSGVFCEPFTYFKESFCHLTIL